MTDKPVFRSGFQTLYLLRAYPHCTEWPFKIQSLFWGIGPAKGLFRTAHDAGMPEYPGRHVPARPVAQKPERQHEVSAPGRSGGDAIP